MLTYSTDDYTAGAASARLANCLADASSYDVTGVPVWMQGMTIRIARIVIRRDSTTARTYWIYDRRGQQLGASGGGSGGSGESDPLSVKLDGSSVMTGNLNMGGYSVTNAATISTVGLGTNYFAGPTVVSTDPMARIEFGSAATPFIDSYRFTNNTTAAPQIRMIHASGNSVNSVGATSNGFYLGQLVFGGYDVNYVQAKAIIRSVAAQDWSAGSNGTYFAFLTTGTNSTTTTDRMRIDSQGNVLIGTTTSGSSKLDVNGSATIRGNLDMQGGYVTNAGTAFSPFLIAPSASQNVSLAYTYQKLIATNPVSTLYCPSLEQAGSNSARFVYLEIEKGTNSLTLASVNTTNTATMSVTNSGVSSFQLVFPCAGTNLNVVWKWYQL
jgi:hypothetical protein